MLICALRAHVKDSTNKKICIGNCVNLLLKKFNIHFFQLILTINGKNVMFNMCPKDTS